MDKSEITNHWQAMGFHSIDDNWDDIVGHLDIAKELAKLDHPAISYADYFNATTKFCITNQNSEKLDNYAKQVADKLTKNKKEVEDYGLAIQDSSTIQAILKAELDNFPKPDFSEEKHSSLKQQEKAKLKKKIKFIIGNKYSIKTKSVEGSRSIEKTFVLKKFAYVLNEVPVNVLIMKQISGEQGNIYTLSKHDCIAYHLKYEPGLQVWPMDLNWKMIKDKK